MKKLILLLFFCIVSFAQKTISGRVLNKQKQPINEVNVYIEGTYDGALTNEKGEFSFSTLEKGTYILKFSKIGLEEHIETITIENYVYQDFVIMKNATNIEAITITAGTIKAGDNSKVATLKALDIVTTAGAMGDIVAALETMPGTNAVGESGKLFVRGGEANETVTFVDGIKVAQPYGASPINVPTRTRFSPFLFKGITFSTGGYSAEFGNALSSVLLLNTIDEPSENQTDISIMSVGIGIGKSKKWKTNSITFNGSYSNLKPYYFFIPQNLEWKKAPETIGGEMVYKAKLKKGLFKWYAASDYANMNINQKDINYIHKTNVILNNFNAYTNATYKGQINDKLQLHTGVSYGFSDNKNTINSTKINSIEHSVHSKIKLRQSFARFLKLNLGSDYFFENFTEKYIETTQNQFINGYKNSTLAIFSEAEINVSTTLAFNLGARSSKSVFQENFTIEPRLSFAYKWNENSQISGAFGKFTQTPNQEYLKFNTQLNLEKTTHYILNYLYNKNNKMLRIEGYLKEYNQLIKYNTNFPMYASSFTNTGFGYAKGLDFFWRDTNSIKNFDYWFSYSFIDSKRDFKNYEKEATPNFIASHNCSIVSKYWINKLKSQFCATYTFQSGRTYNNPNEMEFMNSKTKSLTNLSVSWAYLLARQKILYFTVSNILGASNVYGYQYTNSPDASGIYQRQAITPSANRFFFVGFFWTISNDKKTNQLNNL